MIRTRGATVGKMAMGIKVVCVDGSPVSWGRAIGRYYVKVISYLISLANVLLVHLPEETLLIITFLYNLIAYGMAGIDVEKRALHDRICRTRVIIK